MDLFNLNIFHGFQDLIYVDYTVVRAQCVHTIAGFFSLPSYPSLSMWVLLLLRMFVIHVATYTSSRVDFWEIIL